ncbi:isopeptide-forming domain-containing fimbrial protein [Bacillus anthracis]|uniref:isopeptide-forming domain-containing fimbrial protein n=1 Tax=Bacillus anthracis TaxID=1392 RepID=UPI003BA38740
MQKYFGFKKYGKRFKQTILSLLAFLLVFSGVAPSTVLQTVHAETASSTNTAVTQAKNKMLTYKFDNFSSGAVSQLFTLNDAAEVPGGENFLRLTPASTLKCGAAFTKNEICSKNNYSFSTAFSFKMSNPSPSGASDGLTFTIQGGTSSSHTNGGSLNFYGIKPSFTVKYDTFLNTVYSDPSANYIGLAKNGNPVNQPGWYTDLNQYNTNNGTNYALSNGTQYYTWIDYDGLSQNVQVLLGTSPDRASAKKVLDVGNIDLGTIFNGQPYHAGFTASTGSPNSETHDINSWYFVNDYVPIETLNSNNDYKQAPSSVKVTTGPSDKPGVYDVTAILQDPLGNPVAGASLDSLTSTDGQLTGPNGESVTDLVSDADGKIHAVLKNFDHSKDTTVTATVGCATDSKMIPAANQPPTAPDDEKTISVNTKASGQVKGTDPDGDSLTYRTGSKQPSHGTVVVNEDGTWTYTPSKDYVGDDSFTVMVDDGHGGTSEATIVIHVKPTPVLESKKEASIQQKADGNKDATHPEVGDTLLYTIQTRNTISDSPIKNAVIEDQLPAGLEYVLGTLQVDGKAVTDTEGDDNGHYIQGKVTGKLGDITDAEWHSVTFHAKVKADQAGKSIQNKATVTGDGVPPQEPTTTVEVSTPETPTPPANSCGPMGRVALINGGFEQPPARNVGDKGSPGAEHAWMYFYEHEVPGWKTTATDKFIQIMQNSNEFLGPKMGGNGQTIPVVAAEGKQYAELNANQQSMLYQDVATTPGQTIYWRLAHRGEFGIDTMQLRIGSSNTLPNDLPVIEKISSTNNKWTYYTGSYKVPAGQTMTRFGFDAVSSSNGDLLWGNLLDDIFLGTDPCVSATKSVDKEGQVKAGDELTYKVKVKNDGGDIAAKSIFTDAIPAGTEYVPGSIQVTKNGQTSMITDGKDTDSGYYQDGKVTVDLGDLPNTDILPDGVTVQFKVKVLSTNVKQQIKNKANVAYKNLLTNTDGTVETNEVVNEVEPETPTPPANSCGPMKRVELINGSFENPNVLNLPNDAIYQNGGFWMTVKNTFVPGWKTTDSTGTIEFGSPNKLGTTPDINNKYHYMTDVPNGEQYVELNSYEFGQLYQDIETTPGQTISWRLSHRAAYQNQTHGYDQMAVRIGSNTIAPGNLPVIQMISTHTSEGWVEYHGTYTVPANQTVTRFGFEAVKSVLGQPNSGNFLDDIFLGTEPCVSAKKSVSPEGQVKVGDELTYNVTVKNDGGDVASNAVFTDAIPEGTEYVPGTIKVIKDAKTTNVTDETDTDLGYYQDGKVTVKLGDLPNTGILPDGVTVQFKVKVLSGYVNKQITNKAHIAYKNLLKNEDQSIDTNEVINNVILKDAKVESKKIAKNLQDKNTEVGDEIEYTIQMRNTVSDSIVKNAVIEDQLPEGLEYVPGTLQVNGKPVTDTEGDDNGHYVQGKFTGQLGDITDTEWHTVVFHAKVKAGQAGQDIQNTAKVTGENVPPQEPSTTVEVYPRSPKVESKKTAKNLQDKNIEVGDEIEYTIQMRNTVSDSIVKNAVIEDQLPEALEYVPGTLQVNGQSVTDAEGDDTGHYVQGKVTGQLGDITDTEWHTVVFHAKVKAGQEGTAIQNIAKVTGEDVPPQEPTTEIKVQPLGQIEIEKVDAADSTIKLKNAVFQIIDKDGKEVGKLTTDENGKATSELLLLGKYTVKEIKAPDGYMLLKDPIEVEVSSPLQKITVENTKNGWNIPHTGGIGTTVFYLIGMIIMVAALVVFFRKRAKNK